MKTLFNCTDTITKTSVCAIGGFDGVHRGHQSIIATVKSLAGNEKKTGIITFHPLPIFILKGKEIFYLTPEHEKERIFEELGLDFVFYIHFTKDFSELSPLSFIDYLFEMIKPATIVVGENFHYGKNRRGTTKLLADTAASRFKVEVVPKVKDEGTISSTRIRELLLLGNIKAANYLLGRKYTLYGEVIKGKGRGTSLGYPTINIQVDKEKLLPLDGVYKVIVNYNDTEYLGGMFSRHGVVEVHLLGFSGNLYEKKVAVRLLERIRDIKEFASDNALKSAIARDIEKVRDKDL